MERAARVLAYVLAAVLLARPPSYAQPATLSPTDVAPPQPPEVRALYAKAYTPPSDREFLLGRYYEMIKDLPYDYGQVGSIVEALAHSQLEVLYPAPHYEVIGDLDYQEGVRTVGELDLVVFDRESGRAVLVAEAKLTDNFKWARRSARKQIHRFQSYLHEGKITRFIHTADPKRTVTTNQFTDVGRYVLIGPRNALAAGFDYEVDVTRTEADELQAKLLKRTAANKPVRMGQKSQVPSPTSQVP